MRGDHNGLGRDLPDMPMPSPPRGLVIIGVLVLLGAIMLLTMFYTVEADEVAVVQRFGKYLTIWKRQPNGSWRFVVDGGNLSPTPAR